MSYEKYDIASEQMDIVENYKIQNQSMKPKDQNPNYYKLGPLKTCEKIEHPYTMGFHGYKGEVCNQGFVDGPKENKKAPNCKSYPWYCTK